MPKTVKRYYIGPHDAIEAIVDGQVVELDWGESVDVAAELAEAMDQTPDIWSAKAPQAPVGDAVDDTKDGE